MALNGHYIGTPNGIVLCVDRISRNNIEGRLFHGYLDGNIPFTGFEDMVRKADSFFDGLGFPQRGTYERNFETAGSTGTGRGRMTRMMDDGRLLQQHGEIGTFVIRVQHRQHSSWQGRVTWLEEDETVYFRSALELLKLIDGALDRIEDKEQAYGTNEAEE